MTSPNSHMTNPSSHMIRMLIPQQLLSQAMSQSVWGKMDGQSREVHTHTHMHTHTHTHTYTHTHIHTYTHTHTDSVLDIRIDRRSTLEELKKKLEEHVNLPSSQFKVSGR